MKFDWGTKLNILAYMRRFQTWDALYEDLRRRETGDSGIRSVSPIAPKQLKGAKMRELTDHIVPGDAMKHLVKIEVLDEPGAGGAHHLYRISYTDKDGVEQQHMVSFQNGPIKEAGINGVPGEAHMAIEIDRLRCFQAGPYACRENAIALTHLEEALMWLQRRTIARIKRGVEGTHEK